MNGLRHCTAICLVLFCAQDAIAGPPESSARVTCTLRVPPLKSLSFSPGNEIVRVTFASKGKLLVASSGDNIFIQGIDGGAHKCHKVAASDLALSPDGKLAFTVSGRDAGKLLDLASGALKRKVEWVDDYFWTETTNKGGLRVDKAAWGHRARRMNIAAFSPDGEHFVAAGDHAVVPPGGTIHGDLRMWDVATGSPNTFTGHGDSVSAVAFRPDGRQLVSGARDGTVVIWALPARKTVTHFKPCNKQITSVAFSPDGGRLAVAGAEGVIKVLNVKGHQASTDLDKDRPMLTLKVQLESETLLNWSPDGRYLVSGTRAAGDLYGKMACIRIWSVETGKEIVSFGNDDRGYAGSCACFDSESKLFATGHSNGTVKIWEVRKLLAPEGK